MDHEETTFSEQLIRQKPWKLWAKENWHFLTAIIVLTLLSVTLLIKNQLEASRDVSRLIEAAPAPPPPPKPPQKIKRNKGPLSNAKRLHRQGHHDKAIALLLDLAKAHPSLSVRKEAAGLAKNYHARRQENARVKKIYLEGYILFHTHPRRACGRWKQILYASERGDPYVQKARWRWERDCAPYFNER